jgi:hypothetical protein
MASSKSFKVDRTQLRPRTESSSLLPIAYLIQEKWAFCPQVTTFGDCHYQWHRHPHDSKDDVERQRHPHLETGKKQVVQGISFRDDRSALTLRTGGLFQNGVSIKSILRCTRL